MDETVTGCSAGRKIKNLVWEGLQWTKPTNASSMWLCLMQTGATKDILYNRHTLKHKRKAFSWVWPQPHLPLLLFQFSQIFQLLSFPPSLPQPSCMQCLEHYFLSAWWTFPCPASLQHLQKDEGEKLWLLCEHCVIKCARLSRMLPQL